MSIYLNQNTNNLDWNSFLANLESQTSTIERISSISSRILHEYNHNGNTIDNKIKFLFKKFYIEDTQYMSEMIFLLQKSTRSSINVNTSTNSGIYFVSESQNNNNNKSEKIAVCKTGIKRGTTIEPIMNGMARKLGLGKYIVPVVPVVLQDPPGLVVDKKSNQIEEPVEELWSNKDKVYLINEKNKMVNEDNSPKKMVCSLQPFINAEQQNEHSPQLSLFLLTMLMIAIGGRDIKKDGIINGIAIDFDDCMPIRHLLEDFEVDFDKVISALDLKYLDEAKEINTALSKEEIYYVYSITSKWNIPEIINWMRNFKINYKDEIAESIEQDGEEGTDEGNCDFMVEIDQAPHLINGSINHLDPETNPQNQVFLESQLKALKERLLGIQLFVKRCKDEKEASCTTQALFFAVDPITKDYYNFLRDSEMKNQMTRSGEQALKRSQLFASTGHLSPKNLTKMPIANLKQSLRRSSDDLAKMIGSVKD